MVIMVVVINNSSAQLRWADKFQNDKRRIGIISVLKALVGKMAKITEIIEKEKTHFNTSMKKYEEMSMSVPISRIQ